MAILVGSHVIETDADKSKQILEHGFGEQEEGSVTLSSVEALYLVENKKLKVNEKGRVLSFEKLIGKFKQTDKDLDAKYFVYKDLRKKGYVARTGLKYGTYFRVYEKGVRVGEGHSHWLVQPIKEEWQTSIYEISKSIRLAHSVRKKIIWAVVDSEGDVTYYKFERIVP